jgi:serine phosphatase RsbU (regulator of sigma subunit)
LHFALVAFTLLFEYHWPSAVNWLFRHWCSMNWLFLFLSKRSRTFISVASGILVLLVGWLDYLTGDEVSVVILYLFPVVLAAWYGGRVTGIAASLSSAVVWFMADFVLATEYSQALIPYWNAIVMFGIFALMATALSELRRVRERERKIAREIQENFLPRQNPEIKGFSIAGIWEPADGVGGDYYDVLPLGDSLFGFCVADVIGHGVPAALLMSNLQATVRILGPQGQSPKDLCRQVNEFVSRNIAPGKFITFFYAVLDTTRRTLTYTNAGHNPPLLVTRDGEVMQLTTKNTALGILVTERYRQSRRTLKSGDILMLYTDGVVEAANVQRKFFGEERLIEALKNERDVDAETVSKRILQRLREFTGGVFQDDIVLVVIKVH